MRKDTKMWKMCIDVHGIVFANGTFAVSRQCPHCQEISEARKQLEADWEADETGTVQELSLMSGSVAV